MNSNVKRRIIYALFVSIFIFLSAIYSRNLLVHYPDEHFQTLEIASFLMNQFGWKSWEWLLGSRSYFVPFLYLPLFGVFGVFGLHSGSKLIYLLKLSTSLAVFSGVFWGLRKIRHFRFDTILLLFVLLLHPFFLYFSTTTFTDTLSMGLIGALLPRWSSLIERREHSRRELIVSGCAIGALFLLRVQNIFFIGGLGLSLLLQKRFKQAVDLSIGICVALLSSGALDWVTWGTPFKSTIENVYLNVFKGVASSNGIQPATFYFTEYVTYLGWAATVLFIAAFLYRLYRKPLFYLGPTIFLVAHILVPHKEIRFLLPLVPFFIFALLETFEEIPLSPLKRRGVLGILSILLFIGIPKWRPEDFTTNFGIADLSFRSGKVLRDLPDNQRSLLLIDAYWVWGRGEMAIGAPVLWKEVKSSEMDVNEIPKSTVVLLGSQNHFELEYTLGKTHQIFYIDPIGRSLWIRK